MSAEQNRQRILELFEAALQEEPAKRPEFLLRECGANDWLWAEVSSLVAEYEFRGETVEPQPGQGESRAQWPQTGSIAPTTIGHYEIGRELGRGGMGVVFEARDFQIGRTIALKTIRLDQSGSPVLQRWLRERLFREARSAGALSHPNIVTIYESDAQEDLAYIAMEYVDGPTLLQRMNAAGRLPAGEALDILRQAAGALDYAHEAGVVHRDIKPANLMLHHGTMVKITDFGIAKVTSVDQITRTATLTGTPSYMSPEQIQGLAVDGTTDQFSLAVVAYEMLTGWKPFRAESVVTVVHQIVYGERPAATSAAPDLPPAVDEVFYRALAKSREDRYGSCAEFVAALEKAIGSAQEDDGSRSLEQAEWVNHRAESGSALTASEEPKADAGSVVDAVDERHRSGRSATVVALIRKQPWWLAVGFLVLALVLAGVVLKIIPGRKPNAAAGLLAPQPAVPLDPRHLVLQRDFDRLGLRMEALLDHRPSNPHRADGATTWRNVPAQVRGLSDVAAMAGGWGNSTALTADGTFWIWGWNEQGQLGDGDRTDRPAPVPLRIPTPDRISAAASGAGLSMALTAGGSVWSWGRNDRGELGDGTTIHRSWPVRISGLSDVVAIAATAESNLALRKDGTVWAWGHNDVGQLGDGSTTDRHEPVQVNGLTEVTAICKGEWFSLALRRDGSVWAWGSNAYGQLGDGTMVERRTPVRVVNLTNVTAIAAGSYNSVALKRDGTVWAWGRNTYGELGDGTSTDRHTPVEVEGLSSVTAIAAGSQHTFALKRDGTVWAWGQNEYGVLGDGTWKNRPTPARVSGLSGVVAIASGGQHGMARKSDGTLWTWGWNDYGQLGPESVRELENAGMTTMTINYKKSSGRTYAMPNGGFPWIQFDQSARRILLHPGKFGTSQWGAALGFNVATDGDYSIRGAFQRAYDFPGAGDGVDVVVVVDMDDAHPLWAQHIDSRSLGKKPFSILKRLSRGQVVRFVVYSGPQSKDGTFDETALEAMIDRQ